MIERPRWIGPPAPPPAPSCMSCKTAERVRLTDGREIYPHRPDLHEKPIWICDSCGGRVGCHPGTLDPLGTPADAELRRARSMLHDHMLDPLWRRADASSIYAKSEKDDHSRRIIRRAARVRVYAYLADRLGLTQDETHVGMFDLETCRKAWVILRGVKYEQIREWAKARKEAA